MLGINPADESNAAIRRAASSGHLEVVHLLLSDRRVNPTDIKNEALRHAGIFLIFKNTAVLGFLELGFFSRRFVTHYLAGNGHTDVVSLLLEDKRVDPTAKKNKAFRFACGYGHVDTAKFLLQVQNRIFLSQVPGPGRESVYRFSDVSLGKAG
jgi:ankyrin repeat protein